MPGRWLPILLLLWPGLAGAADPVDVTGRTARIPDQETRVPAGPLAAVLLEASAPDPMLDWPSPIPDDATPLLPQSSAQIPQVPGPARGGEVTADIRAVKPAMVIFSGRAMHDIVMHADAWRVRAVREGHVLIAPGVLFGWLEELPSINRLPDLCWLVGHGAATLAPLFNAVVYGRALQPAQLATC